MVERDRQTARGRIIAEDKLRHSPSALRAGIPRLNDRLGIVVAVGQINGAAAHIDDNCRHVGLTNGGDQCPLALRQQQVGLVAAGLQLGIGHFFALDILIQSHGQNDQLAAGSDGNSLADTVVGVLGKVFHSVQTEMAALRVVHAGRLGQRFPNAVVNSVIFPRRAAVVALQRHRRNGVGTDDCHGMQFRPIQRQEAVLIFQQHQQWMLLLIMQWKSRFHWFFVQQD